VHDGDTIIIDPADRTLTLDVNDAEIEQRMKAWHAPEQTVSAGSVRDKYVRLVSSAHYGCVQ